MPRLPAIVLYLFCSLYALRAGAAPNVPTALGAVKLLPKGTGAQLAFIAGYEGQPVPERWHILVNDPKEENGLREYVVAKGALIGAYAISQFADKLGPADVIGAQNVKVDSDRAAKLAQEYAKANRQSVSAYNYELRKEEPDGEALWHITCLGAEGQTVGTLVLLATKGTVVAHEGFELEPPSAAPSDKTPVTAVAAAATPGNSSSPESSLAATPAPRTPKSEPHTAAEPRHTPPPSTPKPKAVVVAVATPVPIATPLPAEGTEEPKRPGFFRRAGGSVRNIFGGRPRDADQN